jgi:thiol-disulfide isomerase/thioredoxin
VAIGIQKARVSVSCGLKQGDKYITIEGVQKLDNDETINLDHKQGEVWLVDFWATWCPPCQDPMAHNQHMLEHKGAEWGGNVKIIGLSIDENKA